MKINTEIETKSGDIMSLDVPVQQHQNLKQQVINYIEKHYDWKYTKDFIIKNTVIVT